MSSTPTPDETPELWDRATVLKFFGGTKPIHVSTLYRGIHDDRYPPPVKITDNIVRWLGHECRAALHRIIEERDRPKPPKKKRGRRPRRIEDIDDAK